MTVRIAGRKVELDKRGVERRLRRVLPEPIRKHYVVVGGRRYPPKQVVGEVTGIDRADFTTHQARSILRRLGFPTARVSPPTPVPEGEAVSGLPYGGRQAAALAPYRGKYVALGAPTEVLVAADSLEEVVDWLVRHKRQGSVFRVPRSRADHEILGPR
jgi:hypothetical protein